MSQLWLNPATAVHRWARISGSALAIVYAEEALPYSQLSRRVLEVAAALAAGGVRAGSRVAYLGLNSPLFLETLLGAAHLGAVFVPVNFRLAPDEVAYVLDNAGCHSVVIEEGHRALVDKIADAIPVQAFYLEGEPDDTAGTRWRQLDGNAAEAPGAVAVEAEDVAMLMYTSGTTGRPKGVMLTYGNLWWNQVNVHVAIDIRPTDATLAVAPLFHIGGLGTFPLSTLTRGGTVVIHRTFDPGECLRDVARYRIASVFMVPVMFAALQRCEDFGRADLSSLRAAIVAGAPVPPALVTAYADRGVPLQQAWGLTETTAYATYLPPHLVRAHPASAGFAVPCTEVLVMAPETGRPVAGPGVPGELCVRGPNVTCGYWADPEATAAAIDADGWFHTGDLGYLDQDGLCYVIDRLKDLIISGGENISPAEIERVLAEFPGVQDVAVVGVPDSRWGQAPVAVLCSSGAEPPAIDAVRAFAAERLARFKLPAGVLPVDALPRNASGKIDRAAVRALAAEAFSAEGSGAEGGNEATQGEKRTQ